MELIVFSGVVSAALLVLEARDYLRPEFPRRATGSGPRLHTALAQRGSA